MVTCGNMLLYSKSSVGSNENEQMYSASREINGILPDIFFNNIDYHGCGSRLPWGFDLSCTHVGISSLRIEGAWMVIGQGAGIAAALTADQDVPVQKLTYAKLRERLLAQGQVLQLPDVADLPTQDGSIAAKSLPGIVLDDAQAKLSGTWSRSTNFKPYIEGGYIFCGDDDPESKGDGKTTATFRLQVPKSGRYQVLLAYSAHATRSKNVPLIVSSGADKRTFTVDQTKPLPSGKHFRPVATVDLRADMETVIEVTNADTTGFVILDALQLLPVESKPKTGE